MILQRWLQMQGRNTYAAGAEAMGDVKGADQLWDKQSLARPTPTEPCPHGSDILAIYAAPTSSQKRLYAPSGSIWLLTPLLIV